MNDKIFKKLGARKAKFGDLRKQKDLLIVEINNDKKVAAQSQKSSSKATIIVDGRVVTLDKWIIEGNIRNGFFKVIWAGQGQDRLWICWISPENCNGGGGLPDWMPEFP